MWPECLRKDWRGKSCWLHPRESGPEVVQEPGGVTACPILLIPVLVWSQHNCLRSMLAVMYFEPSWGCGPRDYIFWWKQELKMNEWKTASRRCLLNNTFCTASWSHGILSVTLLCSPNSDCLVSNRLLYSKYHFNWEKHFPLVCKRCLQAKLVCTVT